MKYNPGIHHRRSIRLQGYDYSRAGLYFVTICTRDRLCLFGKIQNGKMILNDAGTMIERQWQELINHFEKNKLHEFIVMPNHFHGIIEFPVGVPLVGTQNVFGGTPNVSAGTRDVPAGTRDVPQTTGQPQGIAPTVGNVVGAFKSLSTNEYIRNVKKNDWQPFNKKLWQRNFYEHIVRDHGSYRQIAEYIQTNPLQWQEDKYYE
ncbi:transposase IS200 like protein [bacterium BMS3Bbin14]|nr:transposase IS200 like protein [bacterium BMS3Bbin14]